MKSENYPLQLAQASVNARDALRMAIPRLEAAIRASGDPSGLLGVMRNLCAEHSSALLYALKGRGAAGKDKRRAYSRAEPTKWTSGTTRS